MLFSKNYLKYLLQIEEDYENALNSREEFKSNREQYYLSFYNSKESVPILYFDDTFIDFFCLVYLLSDIKFNSYDKYFFVLKFYLYNYSIFKLKALAERFVDDNNLFINLITTCNYEFILKDFFTNLILIKSNSFLIEANINMVLLDFVLLKMKNFEKFIFLKKLNYKDYEHLYSDKYISDLVKSFDNITDEKSFNFYLKKIYDT
jgi:hypothetical protein